MATAIKSFLLLRILLIGFLLGVFAASFLFSFGSAWALLPAIILSIAAFIFYKKIEIFERLILIGIGAIGCLVGWLVFGLSFPAPDSVAQLPDDSYFIEATVERVGVSEEKQKVTVDNLNIDRQEFDDRVIIFTPLAPNLHYGDRIQFRCSLQSPQPFDGFAYDKFLASKHIYKTCFLYDAPRIIRVDAGNPIIGTLHDFRNQIIDRGDQLLGEPHASLMAGLLLGEKRFTDKWQTIFERTGTTHIVAASGYNVAVVTFILFSVFVAIGIKRKQAFWVLSAGIAAYVVLAGADAAVMRAGLMGFVILLARQSGRRASMLNIILITASTMFIINPLYLRYDVGFQLSMLSTIGLLYLAPILDRKWTFIPKDFAIRESITATVAATICSLPITIISFGFFSVVSIFANALILPFIPFIMAFGFIAIMASFIIPIGPILIIPAWAMLEIVLFILEAIASLPIAVI